MALKLAERPDVRLGSPVERIAWGDDGVRWRAGAELEADACVVAVPAEGARPDRVRARAARAARGRVGGACRYGEAAKLFVPLRTPGAAERRDVGARALLDLDRNRRRRRAAAGGERVRRLARRRSEGSRCPSGPEHWLASLERLRPDLELDTGGALLSTWGAGSAPPTRPRRRRSWPSSPSARSARWHSPASTSGGAFAALMEGAIRSGPGRGAGAPSGRRLSSPPWRHPSRSRTRPRPHRRLHRRRDGRGDHAARAERRGAALKPGQDLGDALVDLLPSLGAYALAFALVGRFWVIHHNLFEKLRGFDRTLMALNLPSWR